jgi:hypothetical protein
VLALPAALEAQRQQIVQTLKEALDVHGYSHRREEVSAVRYTF